MTTVTWKNAPVQSFAHTTSSGRVSVFNALLAAFAAVAGDAAFKWEVIDQSTTTPMYALLARKDGSAGRLIVFGDDTTPVHANAARTSVQACLYIGGSPTSTASTPDQSWDAGAPLTTGYMKAVCFWAPSENIAELRLQLFAHEDAVLVGFNEPTNGIRVTGGGSLAVDENGDDLFCLMGSSGALWGNTAWTTVGNYYYENTIFDAFIHLNLYDQTVYNRQFIARIAGQDLRLNRFGLVPTAGTISDMLRYMVDAATGEYYFVPILMQGPYDASPYVGICAKLKQFGIGANAVRESIVKDQADGLPKAFAIAQHPTNAYPALWLTNKPL